MLANYIKIALRTIWRNKVVSILEILGLSIGFCMSLVVITMLKDQFDHDNFHPHTDRTYRIITDVKTKDGDDEHYATTPIRIFNELKTYDFIAQLAIVHPIRPANVEMGREVFYTKAAYSDKNFFEVFGHKLQSGNARNALSEPFTAILSEDAAVRFFGQTDPIGETIALENVGVFTITGVLETSGDKSHIDYDLLASLATVPALRNSKTLHVPNANWEHYDNSYTYALLHDRKDVRILQSTLEHLSSAASESMKNENISLSFRLQQINAIYPSSLRLESGKGGSGDFLWMVSGFAVLILIISMINYFNLSVARSLNRAKEFGVRKVAGALRKQVFLQLLMETVVRSVLALLIAIIICFLVPFDYIFNMPSLMRSIDLPLLLSFLAFAVIAGAISGLVPSLVLSRLRPAAGLNNFANNSFLRATAVGKPLIGFQFASSVIFVVLLLVMLNQTHFMKTSDYGFDKSNIYSIALKGAHTKSLTDAFIQHSNVTGVFATSDLMGIGRSANQCYAKSSNMTEAIPLDYIATDKGLFSALGMELIAGKNFESNNLRDERSLIINETAVHNLGFNSPSESLGKLVQINDSLILEVRGVIKDFNYQSFKFPIQAFAFRQKADEYRYLNVKVRNFDDARFDRYLKEAWTKAGSPYALDVSRYEEYFNERQSYKSDMAKISTIAIIVIILSCIGLFAVIMHTVRQRTKEIGIRKVFGGSVVQILLQLTKGFLAVISSASLIGLFAGWFLAEQITQEFVYRAPVPIALLFSGLCMVIGIAFVVIVSQTYAASAINPVKSLRE